MSKPLDETLSIEIAKRSKSQAKNCFENAYNAALSTEGAMYVQGFVVFVGGPYQPVEYSWLELDNCLADPTWPHLNKKVEEIYYFPAQRLSGVELKAVVEEAKEDYPDDPPLPVYGTQPYDYYGDVMLGGKEYSEAYEEAMAKCRELNKPKTKEVNGDKF